MIIQTQSLSQTHIYCYTVLMIQIDVSIPRPWLTLGLCTAIVSGALWAGTGNADAPVGGLGMRAQVVVKEAEDDARQLRVRQEMLDHEEEILRYQLDVLTELHARGGPDAPDEQEVWQARQKLIALLQDGRRAEEQLLESFRQMWDAQGGAALASVGASGTVDMIWPVSPDEGLSATYGDKDYFERFHLEHLAIDIPKKQGTTIVAPADGVVLSVSDKGMGFNSLTVRHKNGIVTLYGHVSRFLVSEGERVHIGDPIALTGAMPGTPGAGWLTTGPHLHFQVLVDGQPVDPLRFLPDLPVLHRS